MSEATYAKPTAVASVGDEATAVLANHSPVNTQILGLHVGCSCQDRSIYYGEGPALSEP